MDGQHQAEIRAKLGEMPRSINEILEGWWCRNMAGRERVGDLLIPSKQRRDHGATRGAEL
jgi:hypothetical protein